MEGQPVNVDEKLNLFLVAEYEANDTVLLLESGSWIINGKPTNRA